MAKILVPKVISPIILGHIFIQSVFSRMAYLNPRQRLVLSAAIDTPSKALDSFNTWQSQVKLDDIDGADMRLIPLIYKNIGKHIQDKNVAGRLKGIARYTWIRNSYRVDLCARLLGQLNSRGVSSVLIKGSALMAGITDDLSTRQMGDCDLLVASKDKRVAFEAMAREGMRSVPADWASMSEPETELFHGLTFEFPGKLPDVIDLHWRPLREVNSSELTDAFFQHARPIKVYGQQTHVPCPEHMLLHCLVHGGSTDPQLSYDWLADAFLICSSVRDLNWALFAKTALDFRLGAIVRDALEHLRQETGLKFPQAAWDALKPAPSRLSDRLEIAYRGKKDKGQSIVAQTVNLLQAVRRTHTQDAALSFVQASGRMWRLLTTGFADEHHKSWNAPEEAVWFRSGWHHPEPLGRWTASRFAALCLLAQSQKKFGEVLSVNLLTPRCQLFAITSNRRLLCLKLTLSAGDTTILAHLPPSLRNKEVLPLQFYVLRMWFPARRKDSEDPRRLGICVHGIRTNPS